MKYANRFDSLVILKVVKVKHGVGAIGKPDRHIRATRKQVGESLNAISLGIRKGIARNQAWHALIIMKAIRKLLTPSWALKFYAGFHNMN